MPTTLAPALRLDTHLTHDGVLGPAVHLDVENLESYDAEGRVMRAEGLLSLDEAETHARRLLALVALGRSGGAA